MCLDDLSAPISLGKIPEEWKILFKEAGLSDSDFNDQSFVDDLVDFVCSHLGLIKPSSGFPSISYVKSESRKKLVDALKEKIVSLRKSDDDLRSRLEALK